MNRLTQLVCGAPRLATMVLGAFVIANPALASDPFAVVPEPSTLSLLAVGVVGAILVARRIRRK